MLNGGLISIKALLDQLHPSERKTAQFILDNPHDVVQAVLSIDEVKKILN